MAKVVRSKRTQLAAVGLMLVIGLVVSLVVLGSQTEEFTATPYSDVIRFETPVRGVASLQVKIFDLDGRTLWDSGNVSGRTVDWDRRNDWGERLSYGAYLYNAQGWNADGDLVFTRSGRLALMPGDQVELARAPERRAPEPDDARAPWDDVPITLQPLQNVIEDNLLVEGWIRSDLSALHSNTLRVLAKDRPGFDLRGFARGSSPDRALFTLRTDQADAVFSVFDGVESTWVGAWRYHYLDGRLDFYWNRLDGISQLGVGTMSPAGAVDVRNTANQPALRIESSSGTNLIEAYNTGSGTATGLVFRVERESGDVRADGAFYGAGFHTGSADLAEHVNASEPLEPGDVVEIDPDNSQHFRLASSAGSRLVAGVISTQPGVVLGSNADPINGDEDTRPVLALAGRVPVKATTENGPIRSGDILISSSTPGYAMRCDDPASAMGAVIGKALEPLEEGVGLIMIQVTLR